MRNILHSDNYKGLPLNKSPKCKDGFYVEILQSLQKRMVDMVARHNQVFFVRFDLHYPENSTNWYANDNELISMFCEALRLYYHRKGYDPKILWVRELCPQTGQVHFHFLMLFDADYFQNGNSVLEKATDLWQRCLHTEDSRGLVNWCDPHEYMQNRYSRGVKIRRGSSNFQQVFGQCFQWASYLAKCYSKRNSPANVNEFGCSRLS